MVDIVGRGNSEHSFWNCPPMSKWETFNREVSCINWVPFQKRNYLPYCYYLLFKKINRVGQIWTRWGKFEQILELPLRNIAHLRNYKKKWLKYVDICGRYGRKSNFAPPKQKCWNFKGTFAPLTFLILFNFPHYMNKCKKHTYFHTNIHICTHIYGYTWT